MVDRIAASIFVRRAQGRPAETHAAFYRACADFRRGVISSDTFDAVGNAYTAIGDCLGACYVHPQWGVMNYSDADRAGIIFG